MTNIITQKQLITHDTSKNMWGDCYRTAVAVCLGLEAADVPHVYDGSNPHSGGMDEMRRFLGARDLGICEFRWPDSVALEDLLRTMSALSADVPYVVTGLGPRGHNHAVVCCNDQIVCDPYSGSANQHALIGPAVFPDDDPMWCIEIIAKLPQSGSKS